MRLLILTQIVDVHDTSLSFFHSWIEELSHHFDSIHVICLKEGEHHLPANVQVHSLGKEDGTSRIKYVIRFFRYIWQLRHEYDVVFVHMNQEYIVLGGWLWRLMGKKVTMWRNYHSGNFFTDVAAFFCNKVFCTSAFSYTARYKKTTLMPVGIDMEAFSPNGVIQAPNSILSFGRIAPSKRIEVFIEALSILAKQGLEFTADIYGDALPKDESYLLKLQELVQSFELKDHVSFFPGVPIREASRIFAAHEIFVNASPSGMYDKMIFESSASGSMTVASSGDWARIADAHLSFDGSAQELAEKLRALLELSPNAKAKLREHGLELARSQSLSTLGEKLSAALH
jgi:glycosyltransferase involved in cell wall biosynthesis